MAKKKRKGIGGIFILILLFIIAVTVALTVPVFNITSVTVTGNTQLTEEEILEAANIPIGKNIYRVSMKDARLRVEDMPYVLTAEVERRFPAKVVIEVTERTEAAAVKCDGGYAIVDPTCYVLRLTPSEEDTMTVSGVKVEAAKPGEEIQIGEDRTVGEVTAMLEALEKADMQVRLRRIRMDSMADIIVETQYGMEIHLGNMDELVYKLQLCKNILNGGYAGLHKESSGVLRWTNEGQFSYRQREN